jgi:hypothetical protein
MRNGITSAALVLALLTGTAAMAYAQQGQGGSNPNQQGSAGGTNGPELYRPGTGNPNGTTIDSGGSGSSRGALYGPGAGDAGSGSTLYAPGEGGATGGGAAGDGSR